MKLITISITLVEVLMLGALVVLELLAGYKAGVMQHLYFKKIHYLATLYASEHLVLHLGAILACALFLGYRVYTQGKPARLYSFIFFLISCLLFLFCSFSPWLKPLATYAYLLIFLESCIALEMLRIIVASRRD